MRVFQGLADLSSAAGTDLGYTEWVTIDQDRINLFADATGDHQWIHVDAERSASGPFGGTIAHGLLTLSLLPVLLQELYQVDNVSMAVNYGFNKVRFPRPVLVGSTIRANATILDVSQLDSAVQATIVTMIEVEGSAKPACVIESIVRYVADDVHP